jgi:hypothetical protein
VASTSLLPQVKTSGREKEMSKENTTDTGIGFILAFICTLILLVDAVTYHLSVNARDAEAEILLGLLILLFAFRAYTVKGAKVIQGGLGYSAVVMVIGIAAIMLSLIVLYDIIGVLGGLVAVVGGIFLVLGKRATK